jgi:hypothetical protein
MVKERHASSQGTDVLVKKRDIRPAGLTSGDWLEGTWRERGNATSIATKRRVLPKAGYGLGMYQDWA